VTTRTGLGSRDRPDTETARDGRVTTTPDVLIYRISGVMASGGTASIGSVPDRIDADPTARAHPCRDDKASCPLGRLGR